MSQLREFWIALLAQNHNAHASRSMPSVLNMEKPKVVYFSSGPEKHCDTEVQDCNNTKTFIVILIRPFDEVDIYTPPDLEPLLCHSRVRSHMQRPSIRIPIELLRILIIDSAPIYLCLRGLLRRGRFRPHMAKGHRTRTPAVL